MSRLRVINLGLPKSGTTTLARALKIAGLKTADYRIRRRQTENADLHDAFVGQLIYDGYYHQGDPLALMEEFDAFSEINVLREGLSLWPQTDWGVIDAIRRQHPGAKFVATWRTPEALSNSMWNWSNLATERLPRNGVPGLPHGYGETSKERTTWIQAHYAHVERLFAGDENFLTLDIARKDVKKTLSAFLGVEITWWGRANRSPKKKGPDNDKTEAA